MIDTQANKLLHEDSPYLQQHAHNPVHWYPWGEEAFAKALKEDKLIFLSIGYSTCHWCHVMERESFENKAVAKVLNKDFIAIKVDREEYPHIDRHYQDIYALMNRRGGGWPLTIVMTPERRVFFSATYMPADDKFGTAGLKGMMKVLVDAYHDKKAEVLKSATSIESAMARMGSAKAGQKVTLDATLSHDFVAQVDGNFDHDNKGVGFAPKFPHATTLDTLLDIYRLSGDKKAFAMATETLSAMAKGGIYDQIEGGFYRYSTDEMWMIPHFEKMLYTNAELICAYANAYALSKDSTFKRVVQESVANLKERFYHDGLYYSASDADSDGEEGKYFVFDYASSLQSVLKAGLPKESLMYFSIYPEGNFEANQTNAYLSGMQAPKYLKKLKVTLKANRQSKNYPFIDSKIQTSWNALTLIGLFKAGRYIDSAYAKQALHSLDKLLLTLYHDKQLYHQVILGKKPKVKGYLEDYAYLIGALIEGYQVDFDAKYLTLASQLLEEATQKFYQQGVWYMSDDDFKAKASFYDASYVSAKAIMIEDIFKLALLTESQALESFAKKSLAVELASVKAVPSQYPYGVKVALESLDGWVLIKSTKSNLQAHKEQLNAIKYPFVLLHPSKESAFLACKIDRCFAIDASLDVVLKKVEE